MALNKKGFTLVELMVVFVIIGILITLAIPTYRTWQQRIYGSEAILMVNQLINAQIAYYLEHNEYFKKEGSFSIYHDGGEEPEDAREEINKNLHIEILKGHFVDYNLSVDTEGKNFIMVITSHHDAGFNLFRGASQIIAQLDKNGNTFINSIGTGN